MSSPQKVTQRAQRIYNQSSELSTAVPDVIGKRLTMIAQQNPLNNQAEMREMERMVSEKQTAFMQSWQNMATQSLIAQQRIGMTMFNNFCKMMTLQPVHLDSFMYQVGNETLKVIEKGMSPIHATATANSRRLKY